MKICNWEGASVLFDDADYEFVRTVTGWTVSKTAQGIYYVKCCRGIYKNKYLARILLEAPKNMEVDHINGNTLDNRRENLRLVTAQQNQANKLKAKTKILPKGVIAVGHMYRASIRNNYSTIHIGVYNTVQEAEEAYNKYANLLYKEYAAHNSRQTV
jgi:hypothetical protein